jgi:hypothetical protein
MVPEPVVVVAHHSLPVKDEGIALLACQSIEVDVNKGLFINSQ